MKTIAFDVMGNDNGVKGAIDAVLVFLKNNLDYNFLLVGEKEKIGEYISENERIKIIHAKEPTISDSNISRSARNEVNSMTIAINLVKDGMADAVISSGNSGLYLTNTTLILKRLNGVKRPAFAPVTPTIIKNKKFLMLDVGANVDSTAEMIYQWARMGNAFAKAVLNVKVPKVAIINIGTEENKGKAFHREAAELLKADSSIKYVGFAETRDLFEGPVDVAVFDGYAGNIALKAYEGAMTAMLKLIKKEIKSSLKSKIGGLLAKGAFKNVKNTLDYKTVGAAWVLGLNGLAIKSHGSADKESFISAFKQIDLALSNNALNKFKGELGATE